MPIESVNPATGETIRIYDEMTAAADGRSGGAGARCVEGVAESDIRGTGEADEEGGGDSA